MPIIDILGGTGGIFGPGTNNSGSNNSESGSGQTVISSLLGSTGIGSIVNSIMSLFGNLSCIGNSSYTPADFDREKAFLQQILNDYLRQSNVLSEAQETFKQTKIVKDQKLFHIPRVVNTCSRDRMQQMVKLCEAQEAKLKEWFYVDYTKSFNVDQWGATYSIPTVTGFKMLPNAPVPTPPDTYPPTTPPVVVTPPSYPPVTYPPTTPPVVTPPVNYPPVTYPDTTTPPVYNPPVTYPDTTTPYYPPVTYPDTTTPPVYNPPVTGNTSNSSGGLTRTQTVHADGSITIYFWNPDGTLFKTTNIPAPNVGSSSMTSNLDGNIDINGNIGGWNFGLNNNKDQTLYIAGGLGLLGLIAFMAKSKK